MDERNDYNSIPMQHTQTAMQRLITNLETMCITFPLSIQQTFLLIEKEQIINAYESYPTLVMSAEEYYNLTYNQNI